MTDETEVTDVSDDGEYAEAIRADLRERVDALRADLEELLDVARAADVVVPTFLADGLYHRLAALGELVGEEP